MGTELAALIVLAVGAIQSPPAKPVAASPVLLARTVAILGSRYVVFELRNTKRSNPYEGSELVLRSAIEGPEASESVLWRGPAYHHAPQHDTLTFAARSDGSWAILSGWRTDSVRIVHLWTGTRTTLELPHAEPDGLVQSTGFNEVETDLLDSAAVFLWQDRLHMLVSRQDNMGRGSTWVAPLPDKDQKVPEFRVIAEGVDPRIVVVDGEALLALRAPYTQPKEPGPVRFYRSTDLATWTPDLELWQFIRARDNYAIGRTKEWVYLVTTAGVGTQLEFWRYDAKERICYADDHLYQANYTIGSARDRLWLFNPELHGLASAVLFFVNTSGNLQGAGL